MQAFLEERPTCVRCNLDRASMEEILASLETQDCVTVQRKSAWQSYALLLSGYDYLDAVEAFREGWITGAGCELILCGRGGRSEMRRLGYLDVCASSRRKKPAYCR